MSKFDIALFTRAVQFASEKHRTQRRKDHEASPYINHPLALAKLLANEGGVDDVEVLCAAVLHDTIEDTNTTHEELRSLFGGAIATMVQEVTDDKTLPKSVRKQRQIEHAPLISRGAQLIKLADKICNLRDVLNSPPTSWTNKRRLEYLAWSGEVVKGLRGINANLELIFDELYARTGEIEPSK